MNGFTDYADLGIFPLQDHENRGVPVGKRRQIAGGRVVKQLDPALDANIADSLVQYGTVGGMGTLGDIHPWMFWQTSSRGRRATGSWAMAFAGMVDQPRATGGTPTTGGGAGASLLPIGGSQHQSDLRYAPMAATQPAGLSWLVRGSRVVVMPSTDESRQVEVLLPADGRLWCPSVGGPGECGTLVVDLQRDGEACMGGSDQPGIGGRHARIQSMMRVIALPEGGNELGGAGNGLAWNLALSGQDQLAGYGMVWARMDGGGGPTTGGGSGPQGPITGGGSIDGLSEADLGDQPKDFGDFHATRVGSHGVAFMAHTGAFGPFHAGSSNDKHRIDVDSDGNPMNSGHLAIGAYWYKDADKDGPMLFEGIYPNPAPLPMTSRVHLSWDGGLPHNWVNGQKDGMWRWWAEVPIVTPQSGPPTTITPPPTGPRGPTTPGGPTPGGPGGPRAPRTPGPGNPGAPIPGSPGSPGPSSGSTPFPNHMTPPEHGRGGGGPITGGDPIFPNHITPPEHGRTGGPDGPRGPITPGPGGPGDPGRPPFDPERFPFDRPWDLPIPGTHGVSQSVGQVGSTSKNDRSLFAIHHPFMESFGALTFRPQLWISGEPSYEHNSWADAAEIAANEETRPQVLALRSWGAQRSSGTWNYTGQPEKVRPRGGTASGGILFCPPEFEPEDYLGIGNASSTATASTSAYVTLAAGVSLAFGAPVTDGGLTTGSATVSRSGETVTVAILDSARVAQSVLALQLHQSSGEKVVHIGGTQALRLPVGSTAQRQASIALAGGEVRVNSSGAFDVIEFYAATGGGEWREVLAAVAGAAVGSLMVRTASGWEVFAPGADGDVLTMVAGMPTWTPP